MNRIEGVGEASVFKGDPRRVEGGEELGEWLSGLLERGKEGAIQGRPHLYGSDAGFCARRNVLLQHNSWIGNTVNSAGRGYMAIGVAFEGLLIEALQEGGSLLGTQVRGPELPDLKISSRFDAIVRDQQGEVALLEIKTCGRLPGAATDKPQHLAQLQMYSALSGIRNAHLVYMSRELTPLRPIALRTFAIDTSDEALLRRLIIANLSLLAGRIGALPPLPASFRKHTECHYCEFRDHFCWGTRPSRGGAEPEPPLRELTPTEMIRLEAEATERARGHLANASDRAAALLAGLRV